MAIGVGISGPRGGGGGGGTISVSLSNSTPDFGDLITATATPTGLTAPITYTFSAKNNIGDYVDVVQVDNPIFSYDCPYAGTFDVKILAVDSGGISVFGVASITVGTIYAKHSITAAWEGKDSVLVTGQVDSIPDAVSGTYTASAPSSVTRLIKHSQITSEVAGVSTNAHVSTRRLSTSISQLVPTITYFAVIDFNADGLSGAFNVQSVIGGSATPSSNLGARFDFVFNAFTNLFIFQLRNAAGSSAANITSTNSLANGKNFIVASYDGTTLTLTLNGVTQTNTYTGALWSPASCNIIVANTNVSSYTGGCSKPIWVAGVKTSNVADHAQLYDDLLLKYS